jgi:hypothetical protein
MTAQLIFAALLASSAVALPETSIVGTFTITTTLTPWDSSASSGSGDSLGSSAGSLSSDAGATQTGFSPNYLMNPGERGNVMLNISISLGEKGQISNVDAKHGRRAKLPLNTWLGKSWKWLFFAQSWKTWLGKS